MSTVSSENESATKRKFVERYPITATIIILYLLTNWFSLGILIRASGSSYGYIFAAPAYLLVPASLYFLFFFGGLTMICETIANLYNEDRLPPKFISGSIRDYYAVTVLVLLIPTVWLYYELAEPLFDSKLRQLNFFLTANPEQRISAEYSQAVDLYYQKENVEARSRIESLLDRGADINLLGERRRETALMRAASVGDYEFVDKLLSRGADVNRAAAKDVVYTGRQVQNTSALSCALRVDRRNSASSDARKRIAITLIEHGADPASLAQGLETEILNTRDLQLVERLLDAGAPVNGDGAIQNPLLSAASRGDTQLVGLLLKRGADIDAADPQGRTALSSAMSSHHRDVVDFLLANGARVPEKHNHPKIHSR